MFMSKHVPLCRNECIVLQWFIDERSECSHIHMDALLVFKLKYKSIQSSKFPVNC